MCLFIIRLVVVPVHKEEEDSKPPVYMYILDFVLLYMSYNILIRSPPTFFFTNNIYKITYNIIYISIYSRPRPIAFCYTCHTIS